MVRLFLCTLLVVGAACPKEDAAAEKVLGGCRVKLPPPPLQWTDAPLYENASPRLIVSSWTNGLQDESAYHLYWQQPDGLYHAIRGRSGAVVEQPQKLLSSVETWDVTEYQNHTLLTFFYHRDNTEPRTFIALAYLNSKEPPTRLLVLPEQRTPKEIAVAVQGQYAAVAYTVLTEEGPKAFVQLVDLSYFTDESWQPGVETPVTEKYDLSRGFSELLEVPSKPAPVFLSGVDSLSASLSIVPWQEKSFLISLSTHEREKKVYRVARDLEDGKLTFSLQESINFPAKSQEKPLFVTVSATGQVFALDTPDPSRIGLTLLQEEAFDPQKPTPVDSEIPLRLPKSPKSVFVPLGEAGGLARYVNAVASYGPTQNEPQITALWIGSPLFGKMGAQLLLARTSSKGALREKPLRILPGEDIRAADMAVLDEAGLRFGVFYQHQNPEVGLGFVQVDCSQ